MACTPSSAVKNATILLRAKNVMSAMTAATETRNLNVILKNRLAIGTLFAPMQLPIKPLVAYCVPIGTMKSVAETEKIIVREAS